MLFYVKFCAEIICSLWFVHCFICVSILFRWDQISSLSQSSVRKRRDLFLYFSHLMQKDVVLMVFCIFRTLFWCVWDFSAPRIVMTLQDKGCSWWQQSTCSFLTKKPAYCWCLECSSLNHSYCTLSVISPKPNLRSIYIHSFHWLISRADLMRTI